MLGFFQDLKTTYVRYGPESISFTVSPPLRMFLQPCTPKLKTEWREDAGRMLGLLLLSLKSHKFKEHIV